ncbi:helix-turn-helix transcriptional regulator [Novosphingobium sp. KA1]|uniref:helix-turn-helix domain-containing protein n=1 Tax=Novosphingobium sp. (strain KA1) TaxID=164608 RepID=UPI001A8F5FC4|nr:helix-turn-helix transcriptional regulator [Novosphingobium sp. KA1]QSR18986.1 transcriptional regulator [Novosphingobium sp. KA1]
MSSVAPLLKQLRQTAVPTLSIRKLADKLGMGHSSYAVYENANVYKKPYLPIDLARRIAAVLAEHSVDPADVMKLAGLTDAESQPEARAIEAARPAIQYVPLQVALPSEAALRDMFRSLLVLVPDGSTKDETAEILARWLPSGFAGIGPYLPDPGAGASPAGDTPPPAAATDHRESGPSSRT